MNFCDERYVPFFTRDTLSWLRLPWEGKCLLPQLLRRLGKEEMSLALDDLDPVDAARLYTGGTRDFVAAGLTALISVGMVVHEAGCLRLTVQERMTSLSDERYVRLYVRNTTTWHRLGWEGQCLLPLVLRCVDRSGVLDIGSVAPADALAMHTGGPLDFVAKGIEALLSLGVVEHRGESLFVPRFVEAQEVAKSDKLRQRESRERRRRNAAHAPAIGDRQLEIPDITGSASRDVTRCHSEPSELSEPSKPSKHNNRVTRRKNSSEQAAELATEPADTVVVSLEEWSDRSSAEVSRVAKAGVTWFQQLLADVATPPLFSFRREYEYIGSRTAAERGKVADHIRRTEWCASNRRKVTPAHVVRYWADYLAGPRNFDVSCTARSHFVGPSELPTEAQYAAERAAAAAGTWGARC